ncbi:hypothetical protein B4Q13_22270 [Lacticaseibacillus rhamnosus]
MKAEPQHVEAAVGIQNGFEVLGEDGSLLGADASRDTAQVKVLSGLRVIITMTSLEKCRHSRARIFPFERIRCGGSGLLGK